MEGLRRELFTQAMHGEGGGGFADVPFDGMESVAAVGDVGGADVFAGGEEVFHPHGDEGAERDLKGEGMNIDVVVAFAGGVEIDAVVAYADAVCEWTGTIRTGRKVGGGNVLFADGGEGLDAARFANVGGHGKAVVGAEEVGAESQARPAAAAIGTGGLGLQPVKDGEAELLGFGVELGAPGGIGGDEIAAEVIDHGPINHDEVAGVGAGFEKIAIDDAAKGPEAGEESEFFLMRRKFVFHRLHGARIESAPAEPFARPGWRELGLVVAPTGVVARGRPDLIGAIEMFEGEAPGEGLIVGRLGMIGGAGFAGLIAGFTTGHGFGAAEREEVAEFGGVEKPGGFDAQGGAIGLSELHGGDAVGIDFGGNGNGFEEELELAAVTIGREEGFEHGERDLGLVADGGDPTVAGVEFGIVAELRTQGIVLTVVIADGVTKTRVAGGATEAFDPAVFVWRHGLRGELSADPSGFLGEDDGGTGLESGEGSGATADSSSNDGDFRAEVCRGHAKRLSAGFVSAKL